MAAAGVAPAEHWRTTGWREGRNPNAGFDTRYYLSGLGGPPPSGLDPLEHYRAHGLAEGRHPAPPPGPALAALASALSRGAAVAAPAGAAATLTASQLRAILEGALVGRRLLCVSIGHDAFSDSVGGVQLVTAAECLRVGGDHGVHLHLSPVLVARTLAAGTGPPEPLRLLLDAVEVGTATMAAVGRVVAGLSPRPALRLVAHSLLGHRPEAVARLAAALGAPLTCWLHDYATLCEAPQLLRNDYAFCGAPPPASAACVICVHGPRRAEHRQRCAEALLDAELLAPSDTARAVWSAGAAIDPGRVAVRPHGTMVPERALRRALAPENAAPRLAIAGTPAFRKGHGHALALLAAHPGLEWFAAGDHAVAGAVHLAARTGLADPWALSRALAGAAIDLVLALSPWPETFCLVAHEAIAAGCDVLTLAGAGHAAALVRATGRGVVFDDVEGVSDWLADDAVDYVAERRARPSEPLAFAWSGEATADPDPLLLDAGAVLRPERDGEAWRWRLPPGHGHGLLLRSRWFVPNWRRPEPYDDRRLGLAVASVTLDGAPVDVAALAGDGWHGPEAGFRWTDGDATLDVGAATTMVLRTVDFGLYPVVDRAGPFASPACRAPICRVPGCWPRASGARSRIGTCGCCWWTCPRRGWTWTPRSPVSTACWTPARWFRGRSRAGCSAMTWSPRVAR